MFQNRRSASAVQRGRQFLEEHGGRAEQIEAVCSDMSPAYTKGVAEEFP
jgi:transposase